jgi:hypothetical protein
MFPDGYFADLFTESALTSPDPTQLPPASARTQLSQLQVQAVPTRIQRPANSSRKARQPGSTRV